jgi:hypothetical protein
MPRNSSSSAAGREQDGRDEGHQGDAARGVRPDHLLHGMAPGGPDLDGQEVDGIDGRGRDQARHGPPGQLGAGLGPPAQAEVLGLAPVPRAHAVVPARRRCRPCSTHRHVPSLGIAFSPGQPLNGRDLRRSGPSHLRPSTRRRARLPAASMLRCAAGVHSVLTASASPARCRTQQRLVTHRRAACCFCCIGSRHLLGMRLVIRTTSATASRCGVRLSRSARAALALSLRLRPAYRRSSLRLGHVPDRKSMRPPSSHTCDPHSGDRLRRSTPSLRVVPRELSNAAARRRLRSQYEHRPDRHRRPPRPHGPPAQAPAVPGAGPHRRPHHRRLHGPGGRPLGPGRDPRPADPRAGRGQRPGLPPPGRPGHRPGARRGPPQRRLVLDVVLPRRPGPDPPHDPRPDLGPRELRPAHRRRAAGLSDRVPVSPDAGLGLRRGPRRRRAGGGPSSSSTSWWRATSSSPGARTRRWP